jgi:hypothetical protein
MRPGYECVLTAINESLEPILPLNQRDKPPLDLLSLAEERLAVLELRRLALPVLHAEEKSFEPAQTQLERERRVDVRRERRRRRLGGPDVADRACARGL